MKITLEKIVLDEANFLRMDGSATCKIVIEDGQIWLEFYDRDRLRSQCRGDQYLKISLDDFVARVNELTKVVSILSGR
jgi:hypothetical protein